MSARAHKSVTVPPTDVQAALAWAEGGSVAELSLVGRHHVRVLAGELRQLQLWEDRLMDVIEAREAADDSGAVEGYGLLLWEKVLLVVMGVVGLVAGADLLWVLLVELALEGGAP
jgi:hypothetical protein